MPYGAVMTPPHAVDETDEIDERPARLMALSMALPVHELEVEPDGDVLRVSSPRRPGFELEVRCAHRASDDNRLWFLADEEPIAEAHDITGALMALKGLTAVRM